MRAAPYDPVRTLYRTLLIFDIVAILILAIGLAEFLYFEPPGQQTGLKATIVGIYQYDPSTNKTFGPDRSTFTRTQLFAAVVDWKSLPPNITVDARWYRQLRVDRRQRRTRHTGAAGQPNLMSRSRCPRPSSTTCRASTYSSSSGGPTAFRSRSSRGE